MTAVLVKELKATMVAITRSGEECTRDERKLTGGIEEAASNNRLDELRVAGMQLDG